MEICELCAAQAAKTRTGKPHDRLIEMDPPRIFRGRPPARFEEQDYRCLTCGARFTHSTDRNDLPWTLWRG